MMYSIQPGQLVKPHLNKGDMFSHMNVFSHNTAVNENFKIVSRFYVDDIAIVIAVLSTQKKLTENVLLLMTHSMGWLNETCMETI